MGFNLKRSGLFKKRSTTPNLKVAQASGSDLKAPPKPNYTVRVADDRSLRTHIDLLTTLINSSQVTGKYYAIICGDVCSDSLETLKDCIVNLEDGCSWDVAWVKMKVVPKLADSECLWKMKEKRYSFATKSSRYNAGCYIVRSNRAVDVLEVLKRHNNAIGARFEPALLHSELNVYHLC